jgi:hypothetical protein
MKAQRIENQVIACESCGHTYNLEMPMSADLKALMRCSLSVAIGLPEGLHSARRVSGFFGCKGLA